MRVFFGYTLHRLFALYVAMCMNIIMLLWLYFYIELVSARNSEKNDLISQVKLLIK